MRTPSALPSHRRLAALGVATLAVGTFATGTGAASAATHSGHARPAVTDSGGIMLDTFGSTANLYLTGTDLQSTLTVYNSIDLGSGTWGSGAYAANGESYQFEEGNSGLCLADTTDNTVVGLAACDQGNGSATDGTVWVFADPSGDGSALLFNRYGLNQPVSYQAVLSDDSRATPAVGDSIYSEDLNNTTTSGYPIPQWYDWYLNQR
jgi:hypothetical protein